MRPIVLVSAKATRADDGGGGGKKSSSSSNNSSGGDDDAGASDSADESVLPQEDPRCHEGSSSVSCGDSLLCAGLREQGERAMLLLRRIRAWFLRLLVAQRQRRAQKRWDRRQEKWRQDVAQIAEDDEREYKLMEERQRACEDLEEEGVGFISSYYSTGVPLTCGDEIMDEDALIAVYLLNEEFLRELRDEFNTFLTSEEDDDDEDDKASDEDDHETEDEDSEKQINKDVEYIRRKLSRMKEGSKRKLIEFIQLFEAKRGKVEDKSSLISLDELRHEEDARQDQLEQEL
ncbi:unnamed protein product [Notodromas monacha]|uniref:Uncharacterized protein n=1 Tax=Notodromas monacha TaxID=399045 RepID=A0A7R9GGG1_9CRUS|nr:unnamed protein product [Notodromas monacha]CAG0920366.1 unnamed protein product [Notodromas monacha]